MYKSNFGHTKLYCIGLSIATAIVLEQTSQRQSSFTKLVDQEPNLDAVNAKD